MYFSEMAANGGKGEGNNNAGAAYGTGYCDAQCPHDIKFISGEANTIDWKPNPHDLSNNMGAGKYGSCCAEMVRRHLTLKSTSFSISMKLKYLISHS